jgi:hypothetical protein
MLYFVTKIVYEPPFYLSFILELINSLYAPCFCFLILSYCSIQKKTV